jgi:hypothetical protein
MTIRTQIDNRVVGATSSLADLILEYIAERLVLYGSEGAIL